VSRVAVTSAGDVGYQNCPKLAFVSLAMLDEEVCRGGIVVEVPRQAARGREPRGILTLNCMEPVLTCHVSSAAHCPWPRGRLHDSAFLKTVVARLGRVGALAGWSRCSMDRASGHRPLRSCRGDILGRRGYVAWGVSGWSR
jgi:hypothetical protein